MNKLLIKGAVLTAVAASCSYASAATIGPRYTGATTGIAAGAIVSLEGSTSATGVYQFAASLITATAHFAGDEWQFTLSRGTLSSTIITPTIACTDAAGTAGTQPITLDPNPTVGSNTLTYSVTGTSGTTSGAVCTLSSLAVVRSSLTAGDVAVTFAARRNGSGAFERDIASTASANTFSVRSQLGAITVQSAFNGVVDYQGSAGKGFFADDGSALDGKEDTLVVRIAQATVSDTAFSLGATTASLNIVLRAESGKTFAFLDANADGSCTAQEWAVTTTHSGRVDPTGDVTINPTCTELTFVKSAQTLPGVAGAATYAIAMGSKFAAPSVGTLGQTITPMDFPATSTATVTKGSTVWVASTTFDAGEWTSNGSTVVIPYMPANTTAGTAKIQPVVYVTNRSEVSGPATATIRNESGVLCTADLGTINSNRTVNVSTAITNAIATCYNTSDAATAAGHRLNIVITASLPSATTEVYSGFTVGGSSRVSVVNSSNGK
jgi:hypothetical protein